MKKLNMTVTNVIIELLIWVMFHIKCSQFMKELGMSVTSVSIELLQRVILYVIYSST